MGNFLSTLPELGESLWRVVLLNGGVKLAAVPGKALDSLKALEAAGTDILVCGTCLDFYGLLEARQVGQTTNMLDVVTSLALADQDHPPITLLRHSSGKASAFPALPETHG